MSLAPIRRDATPRRGMLLMLVLSILALFLVVGAVGILLALRARESARAFAAATAGAAESQALARGQLDEALLKLIRGPSQAGVAGDVTESLLEDKYGGSQTCSVTALTGTTAAFITATVSGIGLTNPLTIAGRVLTFVPQAGDPTGPTSYRILRTGTLPNTLLLANVKPNTPLPLPTRFPCEAVINNREFVAEPYDAFDEQNLFLTQPVLTSSTVTSIARPAFGASGDLKVDNDGDGVLDGVWLGNVLPAQQTPDGAQVTFDVSYLVLDLDGRINLNAHGSFVRAQLPLDQSATVGMGFGPADVDAALAVGGQAAGSGTNRWAIVLQGGAVTRTATTSSATQWRPAPLVEANQQGRYTQGTTYSGAAPGNASLTTGTSPVNSDFWFANTTTGAANSPTDLKARLQVRTDGGSPPSLQFCRPAGAVAWAATGDVEDLRSTGAASHPYALRLDEDAPRAAAWNALDALFTVGELERILRQFDPDASTLAPRLAAVLDDFAERSRMTVTTDSWDTPAIAGAAVTQIAGSVAGGNVYAVLSPETVAGLRFNLNRPLLNAGVRQEYFRQLYTLVRALGASATDAAQWAANVIEFRDPDSIMSWYAYDTDPLDGVWTTGTGVWGMERPELVISEASASDNTATARLYRPWNAQLVMGTTTTGTTERIDPVLGNATNNTLEATKTFASTSGTNPVWRVRITGTSGGLDKLLPSASAVGVNTSAGQVTLNGTSPPTQIVLQRLADPGRDLGAALATGAGGTNAYVDVHRVSLPLTRSTTVTRWLHWPNRDLVSHGELLTVPSGDPASIPEACFDESQESSLARSRPAILDATIVPSRFAAANVFVANGATVLAGTGLENFSYGQFSRWREAGRVNVNTVLANRGNTPAALDDAVWTALAGRTAGANPFTPQQPARVDGDLLLAGGDARFARSGSDAAGSFLKRSTAIRLANCATTRSHVFAVWITLRITEGSNPPQYARLFAIVDRSIPVACAPGRNLNVGETIRLKRYIP